MRGSPPAPSCTSLHRSPKDVPNSRPSRLQACLLSTCCIQAERGCQGCRRCPRSSHSLGGDMNEWSGSRGGGAVTAGEGLGEGSMGVFLSCPAAAVGRAPAPGTPPGGPGALALPRTLRPPNAPAPAPRQARCRAEGAVHLASGRRRRETLSRHTSLCGRRWALQGSWGDQHCHAVCHGTPGTQRCHISWEIRL